jgi:restriction endonuclease Mrr
MAQEPSLKPIELIDGDQIVALLEKLHLGLESTYTIDENFFEEFENVPHLSGSATSAPAP